MLKTDFSKIKVGTVLRITSQGKERNKLCVVTKVIDEYKVVWVRKLDNTLFLDNYTRKEITEKRYCYRHLAFVKVVDQ